MIVSITFNSSYFLVLLFLSLLGVNEDLPPRKALLHYRGGHHKHDETPNHPRRLQGRENEGVYFFFGIMCEIGVQDASHYLWRFCRVRKITPVIGLDLTTTSGKWECRPSGILLASVWRG